jgi:hypothetical protein
MAFPGRDAADHTNESRFCKRAEMARFGVVFSPSEDRSTATSLYGNTLSVPAKVLEKMGDFAFQVRQVILDDVPDK